MTAADQAVPASRTSRTRLISNSLSSVGAYLVYLPVSLAVNAYVVHRIGLGAFGIWAALITIVGYGSLLDFGVATPLVKYVAESLALGRPEEVNSLLSTALVFYLGVGTVFALGMTAVSGWVLSHVFHAGAHDSALLHLYLAVLYGFVASLTFSPLRSLILGVQRADLIAGLTLCLNLVNAAGIVLALSLGYRVNGLVFVWLGTTALTIAGNWLLARRLFPPLALNPLRFSRVSLRKILRFSAKVQVGTVMATLNDQVDATLIAYALGPVLLGSFQLGSRVATTLRGISYAVMTGILPAASDLAAAGQSERLRTLFLRSTRYLAVVEFGVCAGVAALARPLVAAWLGPGHDRVAVTMMVLLTIYAARLPALALSDVLNGFGRPDIRMRADLAFLLIHIPLSVALIWRFGYYGTMVGTGFALVTTRIYVCWAGVRALGVRLADLLRHSLLHPAIASLLGVAASIALQSASSPLSPGMLLLELTVFGGLYLGYIAAFGLDTYDRELLWEHFLAPAVVRIHRLRPRAAED